MIMFAIIQIRLEINELVFVTVIEDIDRPTVEVGDEVCVGDCPESKKVRVYGKGKTIHTRRITVSGDNRPQERIETVCLEEDTVVQAKRISRRELKSSKNGTG